MSNNRKIVSKNITPTDSRITRNQREERSNQKAFTIWLTGLSGSGKSTLAQELEYELFNSKRRVYWLDGDNVRSGLCRDLGFSSDDRKENIRRIAETANLFNDAGVTVIASFITHTFSGELSTIA